MRIGVDGLKIPESATRGPLNSLSARSELGMAGLFFRTILQMSPTLDFSEVQAIGARRMSLACTSNPA